jgi:hypothetical protein
MPTLSELDLKQSMVLSSIGPLQDMPASSRPQGLPSKALQLPEAAKLELKST